MRARVYCAPVQQRPDPAGVRAAVVAPPSRTVRVAFVGAPGRLAACVDQATSGGVEPLRIAVSPGEAPEALQCRLTELRPDVVALLGPDCPAGAVAGLG